MADKDILWYKDAIIYELHIKAFYDSNGDGIGDLQGLRKKLDYLEDLGITAIWLLPFYPSPLRDDGYDISDYFKINPAYGDIKTFKTFVKEAHKRNLMVITELVINHTSDQHPWFQRARRSKPGSVYRDYYVWSDDPNKYKDARIIFTDYEPSNWSWDPVAESYYWHRFFHHQPDLNYDNPRVQKEIFKIIDYWFDMGVDGFRLDAVPYLFQREGTNCENLPETHNYLKELRKHVDKKYKNKIFLAEANMWPEESASYFGDGDECHMNYHFPIMPRLFMALRMEDRYPITDIIDQTPEIPENCQWAIFLRNHDELTLEMVTDEERDYMYKVYTKDTQARINLGIRHRLAPLLDNNRDKIELLNFLLFSLPGTPVLYYGDEIGMGDNFYLGDRDGVRTPMQWSMDRNAGFSNANPQKLYLPVIIDPEYNAEAVNVETQQMNSSSLLWWMKRIIATRKRFKVFGRGDIKFLTPENPKVIAFTRSFEDETILVVANLSRYSQPAEVDLKEFKGFTPVEVFNHNRFPQIDDHLYLFTLAPHGYFWFLLEAGTSEKEEEDGLSITLEVNNWDALFEGGNRQVLLNKVLIPYLKRANWYTGKDKKVKEISLTKVANIPDAGHESAFIKIELNYDEGLPETYITAVGYCSNMLFEQEIGENKSILSKAVVNDEEGFLIDAFYSGQFRNVLLRLIFKKKKFKEIRFYHTKRSIPVSDKSAEWNSRIIREEKTNTSINYDDRFYLKIFHKIDPSPNPDVEITNFLNEKTNFKYVPRLIGGINESKGSSLNFSWAMLEDYIPNQGDAFDYYCDITRRFFERVLTIKTNKKIDFKIDKYYEFDELPEIWQRLIGGDFAERISMLGRITAEMHLAMANASGNKDFTPEFFSLHYQRSLYSPLQSLTRSTSQLLNKNLRHLKGSIKKNAKVIVAMKDDMFRYFRRIYDHKINAKKIRNHGDFHLEQLLWTGKEFIVIDFEGEPLRSFSERRIKRCPLRDVAGMIRSFHYATHRTLVQYDYSDIEREKLKTWTDRWYQLSGNLYIQAYMENLKESDIVPTNQDDFQLLLEIFLLEKAVYELRYDLLHRPEHIQIPMSGIKMLMKSFLEN